MRGRQIQRRVWRRSLRVSAFSLAAALAILPGPAAASDWRKTVGVFRIGMVAEPGSAGVPGAERVRRAYAAALGVPVELFVARDQAALIDAQASARIDYAIYSALGYATAWRLCSCVEPLAAPVGEDGSIGVRSILIARKDPLSALAGEEIATTPDDALALLFGQQAGDGAAEAPNLVAAASMSDAEERFLSGAVDGLFGWRTALPDDGAAPADAASGTMARLARAGADPSSLTILWTSDPLRFGPHAVRTSLDQEAKALLSGFLTTLLETDPETYEIVERQASGGFRSVVHDDYRSAVAVVRALVADHGGR